MGLLVGLALCFTIALLALMHKWYIDRKRDRQQREGNRRPLRSISPPPIAPTVEEEVMRHPLPRLALAGPVVATPERVPVGRIVTARGTPIMASPSEVDIDIVLA